MSYNLRECREVCADGTYWEYDNNGNGDGVSVSGSGGKCVDCAEGCVRCVDKEMCLECEEGYDLQSDGTCKKNWECTGNDFMKISVGSSTYCVTKKNMGDSAGLAIPPAAGVTSVGVDGVCSGSNCCWKAPDEGYDSNNCTYTSKNRTVCTRNAAVKICSNFKAGNYTWTLPNGALLAEFGNYSMKKGDNGLCLCGWFTLTGQGPSCYLNNGCKASTSDTKYICAPQFVWGTDALYAVDGAWVDRSTSSPTNASVRCVTKL